MSLQWREQLSIGNDLIDSDHKYLIEIINEAEDSLRRNNRSELMAALDNLSQYAKVHFAREEKVASAVGFEHVSHLHESHEALLMTLNEVKQEIGEKWTAASAEHITALLRFWLIDHVIKEDMQIKPKTKKHSPSFVPS